MNRVHWSDNAVWIQLKTLIVQKMIWVVVSMKPDEFSFCWIEHKPHCSKLVLNVLNTGETCILCLKYFSRGKMSAVCVKMDEDAM